MYLWKIVSDYHWLEMAIGFQVDVLEKEQRLRPELIDPLIQAALNFAAIVVEVYPRLTPKGQRALDGRLRDALKAENGFAPVCVELDLAQRLMDAGYDVTFPDLDGTGQFDLMISRGAVTAEIECKSISADAGRQIHRKDFYRFMYAIQPALEAQLELRRKEVVLVTLKGRLSPNLAAQAPLRQVTRAFLIDGRQQTLTGDGFTLERFSSDVLDGISLEDQKALYRSCTKTFGENVHVAGGFSEDGGCLLVMRSMEADDTSKSLLDALRKAASQFSRAGPSFIAVQEHGLEPTDLMLAHVRRRAGIISHALFRQYGARHVNAVCFSGFGAVVQRDGKIGTPGFAVPNPEPMFWVSRSEVPFFLSSVPDAEYADLIGAAPPTASLTAFSIGAETASVHSPQTIDNDSD